MNTEPVLLATKGKPQRRSKSVQQLIFAPRIEHSRKPKAVIGRIEQLFDGPYIELFGRKIDSNSQWRVWGNQARLTENLLRRKPD
jgi:N6-adenosine-specific RNA methylase IME4